MERWGSSRRNPNSCEMGSTHHLWTDCNNVPLPLASSLNGGGKNGSVLGKNDIAGTEEEGIAVVVVKVR